MSELHSFVDDVSNFFAELGNCFQMLAEYFLTMLTMFIHHVSAKGIALSLMQSALTFSP